MSDTDTPPAAVTDAEKRIAEIAASFSETIFWNNTEPFPAADVEEPYPLKVLDPAPPAYCVDQHGDFIEGYHPILIRFESGELTITVAELPPQGDDADAGNVTSKADAAFIANLPVYIPFLLAQLTAERERHRLTTAYERLARHGKPFQVTSPGHYHVDEHELRAVRNESWYVEILSDIEDREVPVFVGMVSSDLMEAVAGAITKDVAYQTNNDKWRAAREAGKGA